MIEYTFSVPFPEYRTYELYSLGEFPDTLFVHGQIMNYSFATIAVGVATNIHSYSSSSYSMDTPSTCLDKYGL